MSRTSGWFQVVLVLLLAVAYVPSASAQGLLPSKYRTIDKTGATISPDLWKTVVVKELGVGNVIFSTSPMPGTDEGAWKDIKKSFTVKEIKAANCFQLKVLWPASVKDFTKTVTAKRPGYSAEKLHVYMYITGPKDMRENDENISILEPQWERNRVDLVPENDFSGDRFDYLLDDSLAPGEYTVHVQAFMRYNTGGAEKSWVRTADGTWTLKTDSVVAEFMVAEGTVKIIR